MISFWEALATNPLLVAALLASFLAAFSSGIVGSYVVVKRIVFISGSISHAVLSGIGLAIWLERVHGVTWLSPLAGALAAAILSALLIGWINLHYKEREDSIIAALWSIGMAVGVLFISQTPGSNVELTNYLVGNVLWVTPDDLITLSALAILIVLIVLKFHQKFLILCFDENQARLQGIKVEPLYLLLLSLTAVTIVLLIQVVGIILVMTMLTIPAAIANLWTKRLSHMMVIAVLLNFALAFFGNWVAFDLDWPIGATIALLSGMAYLTALILRKA